MNNPGGSLTSWGAARLRAVHQLLDGEPKLLRDPVILQLLDSDQIDDLRLNASRYEDPALLGLRSHIVLRSRYAEDRLALAWQRGIRQYLLLGAGLDTFAWRQPPGMEGLRIFEADHPSTQEQKRRRLEERGFTPPPNLSFIPVDFESESLEQVLKSSSFDITQPCFISWLGVTVYLSLDAIDAIFSYVATLPASSELVFSFSQKTTGVMNPTAARAAEAGEPWRTFIRPEELAWKLCKLGFSSLEFLQPEEAEERYYQQRGDGLPCPLRSSVASVIV